MKLCDELEHNETRKVEKGEEVTKNKHCDKSAKRKCNNNDPNNDRINSEKEIKSKPKKIKWYKI